MTTVFGIVKQSGGTVDVYSEPGKALRSKFICRASISPPSRRWKAPQAKAVQGHETILLVEDEEQVRNLVRDLCNGEGYKVLDARQRRRGPADSARSYKGPIHLLITDVVMPKEGGRDLAASLVSSARR